MPLYPATPTVFFHLQKEGRRRSEPKSQRERKADCSQEALFWQCGKVLLINPRPRAAGDRAGGALNSAALGAGRRSWMDLPRHPGPLLGRDQCVLATAQPAHGQQQWHLGGPSLGQGHPAPMSSGFLHHTIFLGSVCGTGKWVSKAALLFKALIVRVLDTSSYILLSFDASASWPGQPEEGS